jgi:hypothetical protein
MLAVVHFDHVLHLLEAGHRIADSLDALEVLIRLELHVFDKTYRQKRSMTRHQSQSLAVALLKHGMSWGKLRRVWEKIKDVGKKVWGGIKQGLGFITKNPLIKGVAQAAATAIGGPAAGAAVGTAFGVGEALANGATPKFTVRKAQMPTWATRPG